MRLGDLLWDDWNTEHIWDTHKITEQEVEAVVYDQASATFRVEGRAGFRRYLFIGRTDNDRPLAVFVDDIGGGWGYPVTARELTEKEKHRYRK